MTKNMQMIKDKCSQAHTIRDKAQSLSVYGQNAALQGRKNARNVQKYKTKNKSVNSKKQTLEIPVATRNSRVCFL